MEPHPHGASTVTFLDGDGTYEVIAEMRLVEVAGDVSHPVVIGVRTTIGTSELADVRIDDRTVSRLHCEILVDRGRARIRDLGSRNGTLVDGVEIQDAFLRDGATIKLGSHELRFEVGEGRHRIPLSSNETFGEMRGQSTAMRRVFAQLQQAAVSDSTVLLIGETGTGKEVAADAIREASGRRDGPFVVVDCGATPANLLESELFGHERGAFTSAGAARAGAFEAADKGTIFLDEIGELPLDLQPKLLRVLAKREIKRIGRNDYRPIDVRVIAATNRDLVEEVDRKTFRSDLYYRLAVIEVRLPPLRERLDDLDLLVSALLADMSGSQAVKERIQHRDSIRRMARYSWPGNVRELRNHLERSVVAGALADPEDRRAPGPIARAETDDKAPAIDASKPLRAARDEWVSTFERSYLASLLEAHRGNVRAAAATAGIDRVYLYRLLWKHGLR